MSETPGTASFVVVSIVAIVGTFTTLSGIYLIWAVNTLKEQIKAQKEDNVHTCMEKQESCKKAYNRELDDIKGWQDKQDKKIEDLNNKLYRMKPKGPEYAG